MFFLIESGCILSMCKDHKTKVCWHQLCGSLQTYQGLHTSQNTVKARGRQSKNLSLTYWFGKQSWTKGEELQANTYSFIVMDDEELRSKCSSWMNPTKVTGNTVTVVLYSELAKSNIVFCQVYQSTTKFGAVQRFQFCLRSLWRSSPSTGGCCRAAPAAAPVFQLPL